MNKGKKKKIEKICQLRKPARGGDDLLGTNRGTLQHEEENNNKNAKGGEKTQRLKPKKEDRQTL